ncbi:MAG: hypothetical protein KAR08_02325, partial [Candidatus Heimdallarchaeota archaeon]|nr:hypothetical protein [Candidatus Heimdallarchaeota archaeon]
MANKGLRRIIWTVVLVFVILSIGVMTFIIVWIEPREGGEGVNIAILDSGIDMNTRIYGYSSSRELKDRIILEKSFVTTEFGY